MLLCGVGTTRARLRGAAPRRSQSWQACLVRAAALLVALAIVLASSSARAQTDRWRAGPAPASPPAQSAIDEARARNAKAIKLYQEEGAVDAALAEMERAYDLAPSWKLLYNLGQVARTARDYALALHAFERYLADGGSEVPADRRRSLPEEIRELRSYVATLTVEVDTPGAELFLDDAAVGSAPLGEPLVVNAGRVRIRAVKGARQGSKSLVVAGGDELRVHLALGADSRSAPDDAASEPPPSPAPEPAGGRSFSPYLWIGWGAAGLLGVGAVVTGALALDDAGSLSDATYAGAPSSELTDLQDSANALAATTDVLIGVASATFVVTTALAIAGVGAEPDAAGPSAGRWSVVPLRASNGGAPGSAGSPALLVGLGLGRTF